VVDVINLGLGIGKFNQVPDDRYNIFLGKDLDARIYCQAEFSIDTVSSDITQVISLFREKQFIDDPAGGFFIWRFGIPELALNIFDGFFFRICGIFLEGIKDNRILQGINILFMKKNGIDP
jgi:hypothetical protein